MRLGTIVLDIETQRDFFDPKGACYRPESLAVARQVHRLFGWARAYRVPVLSTVLRLSHGELGPMGVHPHCITGTRGEQKLPTTVLRDRINFGLRNVTDLPADVLDDHQQLIFEKRHTNIFQHARIERLLTELTNVTFIVCGAGVGQGIVEAVVGLRGRRFSVVVAKDAVLDLDAPNQYLPHERMKAKGAVYLPTSDIILPEPKAAPAAARPAHGKRISVTGRRNR